MTTNVPLSSETEPETINEQLHRWFGWRPLLMALLTFAVYGWLFGWKITLVLMLGLLWHEIGHAYAMSRFGLGVAGFYFIPLLGLAVSPLRPWTSCREEAVIGLAGPAWGLMSVLGVWLAYLIFSNPIIAGIAGFLAFINAFNLMPINPLDGGRIVKSVLWSMWPPLGLLLLAVGTVASVFLAFTWSPVFAFVTVFGGLDLYRDFQEWRYERRREETFRALAMTYFGRPASRTETLEFLQRRITQASRSDDKSEELKTARNLQAALTKGVGLKRLSGREIAWLSPAYLLLLTLLIVIVWQSFSIMPIDQLVKNWR